METLINIFSHVCGQQHPLVIDGAALPVCQRCFGLYAGAALTGLWLIASGLWRRGLPETRVVLVHSALLVAAMLGGMHVIGGGPAWRILCGLWTGHVAMFWLIGSANHLRQFARPVVAADPPWPARLRWQALAAGPALALAALGFTEFVHAGWMIWSGFIVLGAAALSAGCVAAVAAAVAWIAAVVRRGLLRPTTPDAG